MAATSTNATSVVFAFTSLLWEAQIWTSLPCPDIIIYFVVSKNSRTLPSFTALPTYYYASSSIHFVMTSGFYSNNDRQLWWSSCILAFFGILRGSEYTAPTTRTSIPASTQFLLVTSGSAPRTPMWRFLLSFRYCSVRSWLHHSYWLHS